MRKSIFALVVLGLFCTVGCRTDAGRCEDLCETFDDCDGADIDIEDCTDECTDDADNADDSCKESFEALADCASDADLDCDDANDDCDNEGEDFFDDCDEDFEDTFDEIGLVGGGGVCADTCVYAFDGFCDEPNVCPSGTDGYDCGC
jgi:hypothetical protein